MLSPRLAMLHTGLTAAAACADAAKTAPLQRICEQAVAAGLPVVFIGPRDEQADNDAR